MTRTANPRPKDGPVEGDTKARVEGSHGANEYWSCGSQGTPQPLFALCNGRIPADE